MNNEPLTPSEVSLCVAIGLALAALALAWFDVLLVSQSI